MSDKKEINILVWFEIFDQLTAQDYDTRVERVADMFEKADIIYAAKESYRSACEYASSDKVFKMPDYINNDDAVSAYAKETYTDYDKINIITPVEVFGLILDKDPSQLEETFEKLANMEGISDGPKKINIADLSEEEMRKQLPGPIADAFQGLTSAIEETQNTANDIISEYMTACDISGIDEKQAKEEGESYMSSEGSIPAAEFICPVNILDRLRQI